MGDRPARARAAEGVRRGDPHARARAHRRALPRRGRDDHRAGTTQGHFIHITSHRATDAHPHTSEWLDAASASRTTSCYCSDDKIARCVEIGIDVLIDDSPVNLERAARGRDHRGHARAPVEPGPPGRDHRRGLGRSWRERLEPRARMSDRQLARAARAPRLPARDRAGAPGHRLGPLRARRGRCSTRRSTSSSTTTGSGSRSRGSSTSRRTGGALLVSNHAGALPPDAAMIAKAIKTEHTRPRPLHLTVEHFFKGYPGLSHARVEARRRPRPPGQRAPPAPRRGAARARLPRGPQGHREALQGPLPAAALRPRRVRGVRDARPGADRPGRASSAPRRRCRSSATSARCRSSPA